MSLFFSKSFSAFKCYKFEQNFRRHVFPDSMSLAKNLAKTRMEFYIYGFEYD